MNIGIVGSEAAKFTSETEQLARQAIRELISKGDRKVISGACHLGGIDIWAVEEAKNLDIPYIEYPPKTKNWEGFKARNIQIAQSSDTVICITVKTLPSTYKVKGWEKFCYHCQTNDHIKSGGCWTVKYAKGLGKPTIVYVIG